MKQKQQIIDLSVPLKAGIASDPEQQLPKIEYSDHATGAKQMAAIFDGLNPNDLPEGQGWAAEDMKITTHSGTHMDAPYHFHSIDEDGNQCQLLMKYHWIGFMVQELS